MAYFTTEEIAIIIIIIIMTIFTASAVNYHQSVIKEKDLKIRSLIREKELLEEQLQFYKMNALADRAFTNKLIEENDKLKRKEVIKASKVG